MKFEDILGGRVLFLYIFYVMSLRLRGVDIKSKTSKF